MTDKLVNHQSVSLKIKTDRPVLKTPYQIKGVLMKQFPKSEIVPMLNGSYRKKYLYPRIQVKILNGEIIILGVKEGVDPLLKIKDSLSELNFGDITFNVENCSDEIGTQLFRLSSSLIEYNFISGWVALNQNTRKQYFSKDESGKLDFLNTLIGENIVFISKELGFDFKSNIFTKITLQSLDPVKTEQKNWGLFEGKFFTNVNLPNYIGVGNGITRGFGTLFNSEVFEKDIENENSFEELNQESLKSKPLIEENNFSSSLIEIDINRVSKPKISKKRKTRRKKSFSRKPIKSEKNNFSKSKKKSEEPINYNSHEYHQKQHSIT